MIPAEAAITFPNCIDSIAIALTCYCPFPIGINRNVTIEDYLDSLVHACVEFRQFCPGFVRNGFYGFSEGFSRWGIRKDFTCKHVIPGDFCYNSHWFDFHSMEVESLGLVIWVWRLWITSPSLYHIELNTRLPMLMLFFSFFLI